MRLFAGNPARDATKLFCFCAAFALSGCAAPGINTVGDGSDTAKAFVRPVVIAHRGAPRVAPENTLASFHAAITQRADYVETDVAETSDGQLILIHDDSLERTSDATEVFPGRSSYAVSSFTLAEIRRLDAGKWFSPAFVGEKIPTLAELLTLLHEKKVGLFLELKSTDADLAAKVAAELAAQGWLKDGLATEKLVVISFYAEHLRKAHALMPTVASALLVDQALGEDQISEIAKYASGIDIHFQQVNPALLELCAQYKLTLSVWTVNKHADIDAMAALRLGGITTENIAYLRSRLGIDRHGSP